MQKCTPRPPARTIHPLLILAAFMLYQALYFGRLGRFGQFFLALLGAWSIKRQQ